MGELGASCFHTLTNETRDLTFEQWRIARFGMLCTDAQSFADWKAALLKLCSYTKKCNYQTQLLLENFFFNIEKIDTKLNEVKTDGFNIPKE